MNKIFLLPFTIGVIFNFLVMACAHKEVPRPIDPTKDTVTVVKVQTITDTVFLSKNDTVRVTSTNTITSTINNHDTTVISRRILNLRQSAANDGDANVHEILSTINGIASGYICAANWTRNGNPATYRFYMKYDLSQINTKEKIISAKINLYTRTAGATDEALPDVTQTLNNDLQICLVKSTLAINGVTWNMQPTFSTAPGENLVFSGSNKDNTLLTFDITTLVQQIAGKDQKYSNNGFAFKMAKEHTTYTTLNPYQYEAMTFHSMNTSVSYYLPYLELLLESSK